jgi:hypothetical protein
MGFDLHITRGPARRLVVKPRAPKKEVPVPVGDLCLIATTAPLYVSAPLHTQKCTVPQRVIQAQSDESHSICDEECIGANLQKRYGEKSVVTGLPHLLHGSLCEVRPRDAEVVVGRGDGHGCRGPHDCRRCVS